MKNQIFQFVKKSGNQKVGEMATGSTDRSSCPDNCKLKKVDGEAGGCYSESGYYTRHNWNKLDAGERGGSFEDFIASVKKLPENAPFRMNVSGDVAGENNYIDGPKLEELTAALKGKRGWSYTHKPLKMFKNAAKVKKAVDNGFTVNVSADTVEEAEEAYNAGLPAVILVPENHPEKSETLNGTKVVVCMEQTERKSDCKSCQICFQKNRRFLIGFRAHGASKNKIDFTSFHKAMKEVA